MHRIWHQTQALSLLSLSLHHGSEVADLCPVTPAEPLCPLSASLTPYPLVGLFDLYSPHSPDTKINGMIYFIEQYKHPLHRYDRCAIILI